VKRLNRDEQRILMLHINRWLELEVQPLEGPDQKITIDD
jgi:hypothetical protein